MSRLPYWLENTERGKDSGNGTFHPCPTQGQVLGCLVALNRSCFPGRLSLRLPQSFGYQALMEQQWRSLTLDLLKWELPT